VRFTWRFLQKIGTYVLTKEEITPTTFSERTINKRFALVNGHSEELKASEKIIRVLGWGDYIIPVNENIYARHQEVRTFRVIPTSVKSQSKR
jgi:hypothetical protein